MSIIPDDWPPCLSETKAYINLALIRAENGDDSPSSSTMEYDYIHGKVDNIIARKEQIELDEVFLPCIDPETNESKLTIIMDGAPGVGKSTITRKLCIEWARGEMLQEYHLVILIQLRDVELNEESSMGELFPSESVEKSNEVANYYTADLDNLGKRILFIFDGYDEIYESSQSEKSLLSKIIKGERLRNCSVLVTSRPYASAFVKRLQCVNRRIEVLGYTDQQIEECICANLNSTEQANKLVNKLKDRLDIVSLCYIPLSCRIVLFVYEKKNYELPTTLTELYEIFLLHTMKHYIEKDECSFSEKLALREAKCINKMPKQITERLLLLCEIAYHDLKNNAYDEELLRQNEVLSLGLLTARQNITDISVEQKFQFLHLTIKEFLAAIYLVSWSQEKQLDFLRTHINKTVFRMTLLFMAGLTKLEFVPPRQTLFSIESTKTIDFEPMHDAAPSNSFFFLAHMFYESQIKINSHIISLESNKLDFSELSFSSFEALVISHFLSSTPMDYEWDDINVVNCCCQSFLFEAKHKITLDRYSIGLTKNLHCGPVDVKYILPVLTQGLKEFYLHSTEFDHAFFCTLCAGIALPASNNLDKVVVVHSDDARTEFTRKWIKLSTKVSRVVCSQSFTCLLDFLRGNGESILCPNQKNILANCTKCNHSGQKALQSLCNVLTRYKNFDFSNCSLTSIAIDTMVNVVLTSTTSRLKEFNFNDNDSISLMKLSGLLGKGISLMVHNFLLQPKEKSKELIISKCLSAYNYHVHQRSNLKVNCRNLLEGLHIPETFQRVTINIEHEGVCIVPVLSLSNFLSHNQSLSEFQSHFHNAKADNIEASCEDWLKLSQAIRVHKNFHTLLLPTFELRRDVEIVISGDKKHNLLSKMCTHALSTILESMTFKTLKISNLPNVFEDCSNCQVSANGTVQKLCNLISRSNQITELNLSNCQLTEKATTSLVAAIPACLEYADFTGNCINFDILAKWLSLMANSNLSKLCVDGFALKIACSCDLSINCFHSYHDGKYNTLFLNTLKVPSNLKLVNLVYDSMQVNLAPEIVDQLLTNNRHISNFGLGYSEYDTELNNVCHKITKVVQSVLKHTSIQSASFFFEIKSERHQVHISRYQFVATGRLLCPSILKNLFVFLNCDVVKIDLTDQYKAFQDCSDCKTPTNEVVRTFARVLEQSENLEELSISNCQLSADVVEKMASILSDKTKLRKTRLGDNQVDVQAFKNLMNLWFVSNFKELDMNELSLKSTEGRVLNYSSCVNCSQFLVLFIESVIGAPPRQKVLSIDNAELEDIVAVPLKQLFCDQEKIMAFHLNRCQLTYTFLKEFLLIINDAKCSLKTLQLHHVSYLDCSVAKFIECAGDSKLEVLTLELGSNEMKLNCTYNELGKSVFFLLKRTKYLQELKVSKCFVDTAVLRYISEGLSVNDTLKVLNLSACEMVTGAKSEEVGECIQLILNSQHLTTLNLTNFSIDEKVMENLAAGMITNRSLQTLILDSLQVQRSGFSRYPCREGSDSLMWITLFESLKQNQTLQTLHIHNNLFSQNETAAMRTLLETKKDLNIKRSDEHASMITQNSL